MTPIKQGTASRLGLKKPEPVFEFKLSGPDVFGNGGDPLWHDIQRQLREGATQIGVDMAKLTAHVAAQGPTFKQKATPFMEALLRNYQGQP